MMKSIITKVLIPPILLACLFLSCKKDNYYIDGGKATAEFKGTILDYLNSKPANFDTIATIVKLAGMEKEFTKDTITFFAPQDYSVAKALKTVNTMLFAYGKDTVKVLSDIDGKIWKKYLSSYIYKRANKLKDYPQVDFSTKVIYPGQNYYAYSGDIFNIGVVYNNAGGVQYAGYRQLSISYIPNPALPFDNWNSTFVTSSDIQPYHSVVHVLSTLHVFSFDPANFAQDVYLSK